MSSAIFTFPIMFLILIFFVILIGIVTIYFIYYRRTINRRLNQPGGKHLPAPATVATGTLIMILVIIFIIYLVCGSTNSRSDNYANYVLHYNQLDDEKYANWYSMDANPGYTKQTQTIDDVKYTLFVSTDEYDLYHPQFILYVQPLKGENLIYENSGQFYSLTGERIAGVGFGGNMINSGDVLCYVGTANTACDFNFQIGFWTSENYEKYSNEDFSVSESPATMNYASYSSQISFTLHDMNE